MKNVRILVFSGAVAVAGALVSSTGAIRPTRDIVPYAAAKAGVNAMTIGLAHAFGPSVRVNAVMPGVMETRHHEVFSTPERMEEYRRQTPLGRNGRAEEVAEAVVFLASDASSFLTGALLDINGGRFLR